MTDLELEIRPIDAGFSLKARIYDALKTAITGMNIYDDGAQLRLDERKLSEQFGISRTPLREALARLDQEGLVEIVPRRGIYIVRKSKAEILEMIVVWAALESMAARLVTKNVSNDEIATLHNWLDPFDKNKVSEQVDEYSDANINFHQAIVDLSKNNLIVEITDGLFMHVRAIRARTIFDADRARRSVNDHRRIVDAIEARDTELAGKLVRQHTLALRDHVEKSVQLD